MTLAAARAALAAAVVSLLAAACAGGDPTATPTVEPTATPVPQPVDQVFTLENNADEQFIFRLLDVNAQELQITSDGVTTNFAYLPALAETEVAIANGVALDTYIFVLIRGNDTLAFQQVSKQALIDNGWRLVVDAEGFREPSG